MAKDIIYFFAGLSTGIGIGLVLKKSNISLLPKTIDLGPLSKEYDAKKQEEYMLNRKLEANNLIPNNNRHHYSLGGDQK